MHARATTKPIAAFWLLAAIVHLGSAWGYLGGPYPLSIAADGLDMLGVGDLALALLCALLGRARSACAAAGLATFCLGLALSHPMSWKPAPNPAALPLAASAPIRLLQANIMSEGLPSSALAGRSFDVAAIAEWRPGDDEAWAKAMGLRLVAYRAGGGDAAVFSRWPARESGCVEDEDGRCQAVWALLDTPQGPLRAVSLHTLSPPEPWRIAKRDRFLAKLSAFLESLPPGEPLVAAGDFNATWASPSMRGFGSALEWNSDRQRAPSWPSFSSRLGVGFRIDHQLGAKGAVVDSQDVFDSGYSDHLWTSALVHMPSLPSQRLAQRTGR